MIVRISRAGIEIVGAGVPYTGSLLTLLPQRREARIVRVGGTAQEAQAALRACALDGTLPRSLRILSPGEDPWWDAQHSWPLSTTDRSPPEDDSEALLINPLSANAWSPRATISLLRYALFRSSPKGKRWMRWPFTRPTLSLEMGGDFTAVERAELFDVVEEVWGRSRVLASSGISRLRRPPWQLIWWIGPVAVVATSLFSVSYHWPLWQRVIVTLAAASPAFIAKRKQEQLSRSAPRRRAQVR
jgi:hypothetical protein